VIISFSFNNQIFPKQGSDGDFMTAYEAFYKAIEQFNLPASVPVMTDEGDLGLATQSLDFLENEQAFQMIFSEDKMERAKAAIYACEHTLKQINLNYRDLSSP
jgi:hypothetical protein